MAVLATLTDSGRAALAEAVASRKIHLAWGSGLPEWDDLEDAQLPSLKKCSALFNEVGRRTVTTVNYAEPDDEGSVVVPVGLLPNGEVETARYKLLDEPTPYIHFKVNFDFGDAATATIRELGIVMNTETKADLPAGQMYFTPDELENPGRLLAMQILRPKLLRSPSIRQVIEFVMPVQYYSCIF